MEVFYTTLENQVRYDGTRGLLYDHFDNYNLAQAKYFTICAAAAVSGIPYHSAHLMASDGNMLRQEIWDRRQAEPEPELTSEE